MKQLSKYYKLILSLVILVVIIALKEDYVHFDGLTSVRTVIRCLLYVAWGCVLAMGLRREKVTVVDYVVLVVLVCAAISLLFPVLGFQAAFFSLIASISGLYNILFLVTGLSIGYVFLGDKNFDTK